MEEAFADPARITHYHAHLYYDPATREMAERLRQALGAAFTVELGRMHDVPVGPHPQAMYQVSFAVDVFPRIVPWLMLNRAGLDVLVHPMTGNAYDDHSVYAMWLGAPVPLRLDILRRPSAAGAPAT